MIVALVRLHFDFGLRRLHLLWKRPRKAQQRRVDVQEIGQRRDVLARRHARPDDDERRAEVRESIYLALGRTQRAVTDGRWKLCVYPTIGHRQLFDLATDPHELINLAERVPFQHHIDRLMIDLDRWRERIGDPDPLTVEELKPFHVDLTGRARKPDRWQPQWIRETFFDPQPEETEEPAVPEEAATSAEHQEAGDPKK